MTERCEVLVAGRSEAAIALARELRAYGVDVRLTGAETEVAAVADGPEAITATLRDRADGLDVAAAFLVTEGERAGRDGRRLSVRDSSDVQNLAWKLASVVSGAAWMLLDTYVTERAERPKDYRMSPLSQHFGGKRVRIPPGQRVPDDLVLWSPAENREVRLWPSRRWTLLGFGSVAATTVQAVRLRFGDRVNAQVIGGGNSPSELVTLLDRYGHVNRRLAKRGGSVLAIRPDRYVGLHTAPDPEIVLAYLEDLIPGAESSMVESSMVESGPGPDGDEIDRSDTPASEGTAAGPESFST